MNICIVTHGYPTPINPNMFVFVDQLACAWADAGHMITIINPIPLFVEYFQKNRYFKKRWIRETQNGCHIDVISPRYIRISDRTIGLINTQKISYRGFHKAVVKVIKQMPAKPDVLYSHFLPAGCHVGDIGNELNIPSFCAFGESTLWSIEQWDKNHVQNSLSKLCGMISVSSENKKILVKEGLFREADIEVFPNGVDHSLFYPGNKLELRRKYGFPEDAFIGAYTGAFNDDKGSLRAQDAAVKAGDISMIYIGAGAKKPEGSNVLFCGKLQHDRIPDYLSMADFFILPTKAEGCCNAIIEAMACGLPIISSNGAYNDDILSEEYSIRTDPTDVEVMMDAIKTLQDDSELRNRMSKAAAETSKQFDIDKRAASIIDFMKRKMKG